MGIFSRFRDIVGSNINAILDRAEDPEKMVRLMIQEMEDTLIEVKSSCAGIIADEKKIKRELAQAKDMVEQWEKKADLAVRKDREDLASHETAGMVSRRHFGGAGGTCRVNWGLGEALSRTTPWPGSGAGMPGVSRSGDCHGLSLFLGGGARGGCPGSKVSMMIMGPPQDGQG